ncbi:hypothetical protein V6Z11_A05G434400 [Gossypium hirsutum]
MVSKAQNWKGQFTVFVKNIPAAMHWKGQWALFSYHGEVLDVFISVKRCKDGKRFSFVRFSNILDAHRAIDRLNDFVLLGYRIGVKMSSYGGGRKIWRRRSISYKDHVGSEKNRYVWEKGDTSGTSKDDRIANSDVSKKNRFQTRVVKGFVEEELRWKLQRCLVGESASVFDSRNMAERLTKFGLGEISVKRIQGRFFLIEVPDEEFMEVLKQNNWRYLKECFISIEPWSEKSCMSERVSWVEVAGIPLHC